MPRSTSRIACGLVALAACGTDPVTQDPSTPPRPVIQNVSDVTNFGDGRDLLVTFTWSGGEEPASEHQLVVVPQGDAVSGPGPDAAFVRLSPGAGVLSNEGGPTPVTQTGTPLQEGVSYVVFVRTLAGGTLSPYSSPSSAITLERTDLVTTLAAVNAGTGGLSVAPDGSVLMGDFGAQLDGSSPGTRVYRISMDGSVSVYASGLVGASGNAVDAMGNLFQSNIFAHRISKITPEGGVSTFADSGLSAPVGIALAPGGTLYVANCGDDTVARVDPDGTVHPFAASGLLNCPNGITLASDGNLYVSNFFDGNVLRVSPDGAVSVFATFPTSNLGHVTFGNGVLYVAVRGLHQIAEVTLEGAIRTLAGSGARGGRDGAALNATLSFPNDVAVSSDGRTLYFNDVALTTSGANNISPTVVRRLDLEAGATGDPRRSR